MARAGVKMNVWATAEEASVLLRTFRRAGFKDVKVTGSGVGTMLSAVR
jgi:hypothetical protein